MKDKEAPSVLVFVNPAGQHDNIGDSALRRAYLQALRGLGTLHVYLGTESDFNSGLGIGPRDIVYTSRLRWLTFLAANLGRSRVVFAVNSGEFVGTLADKRRSVWQLVVANLVRATGGTVLVSGVSIRPGTSVKKTYLRQIARRSALAVWRDYPTAVEVGTGGVQPDWAFYLGDGGPGGDRHYVAVALRSDRPAPSDGWIDSLKLFAASQGYAIRVVVQVRRDGQAASLLARRLEADVLSWPDSRSHAEHEALLRSFYQSCAVIVSDRIHALIIAATEGATPVGILTADREKVARTFDHVLPLAILDARSGPIAEDQWIDAIKGASPVGDFVSSARNKLESTVSQIHNAQRSGLKS